MIDLKQSVQYVKGVGPQKAALLQKLNIFIDSKMINRLLILLAVSVSESQSIWKPPPLLFILYITN